MALFNWRKWNNILHRDIGYLVVGLTVIFAISGIAVNHVQDWNPNYKIIKNKFTVRLPSGYAENEYPNYLLGELNITEKPNGFFRPSPDEIDVFLENRTIKWNTKSGVVTDEIVSERAILNDMNYLHLNHAKKIWTYFSDLYALALLFLAISGIFVLKGKNGIKGRGKWLVTIGVLLPLLFLVYYKYMG